MVEAAAANAGWCDAVCRNLGLQTRWAADAWTAAERSPAGYPDAVTLSRGVDAETLLSRVEGGVGCSVKDSFAELDLTPWGFHVLFQATWIRRSAAESALAAVLDWHEARTPDELDQWSMEHDLDVFVSASLALGDVRFFHAVSGGAGFALHRTGGVVGVSNTIASRADLATVWSDTIVVASQTYPGYDLVGYELGADLEAAMAVGFVETGPLRVWIR
jgi:hypothetical protein